MKKITKVNIKKKQKKLLCQLTVKCCQISFLVCLFVFCFTWPCFLVWLNTIDKTKHLNICPSVALPIYFIFLKRRLKYSRLCPRQTLVGWRQSKGSAFAIELYQLNWITFWNDPFIYSLSAEISIPCFNSLHLSWVNMWWKLKKRLPEKIKYQYEKLHVKWVSHWMCMPSKNIQHWRHSLPPVNVLLPLNKLCAHWM